MKNIKYLDVRIITFKYFVIQIYINITMTEEIISLRINKELKDKMNSHDEVNWSAVIRNLIEKKVKELSKIEEIKKQLETKEEQAFTKWSIELGRKSKKGRFDRLLNSLSSQEKEQLLSKKRQNERNNNR